MALITAAGAPIAPPSPRPFAPVIEASLIGLEMDDLDRRDLARGRRQEVGERGGEDVAGGVVDDLLEEGVGDPLRDAAVHLAVGDHRIDEQAGVLDGDEALDPHAPGLDVDLDHRRMAGVGIGARRIVGGEGHEAGVASFPKRWLL